MFRSIMIIALAAVALTASLGSTAQANERNSIQPAHLYVGDVVSGDHPNSLLTLHNGTGVPQTIAGRSISGAGGYIFTNPMKRSTCKIGTVLAPGATCKIDIRVKGKRLGWHRSVFRIWYQSGVFGSAELRVHIV